MEKDYFTVSEMENKTKIPHQTIRRYMKIHGHYLIMKKSHRSFLVHEKSIKVLNTIRSLYSEGKTSKQVDDYFMNNGFPLNLDSEKNNEPVSDVFPVSVLQELKSDLHILHEKLNNQEEFNRLLLEKIVEQNEKIETQQKYIDEKMTRRDELLIKSMREIIETKSLNAPVEEQQNKQKKKWYQLLFK